MLPVISQVALSSVLGLSVLAGALEARVEAAAVVPGDTVVGLSAADLLLYERGVVALAGVPYAEGLVPSDYVWIERTLGSLSLREKVAQLVVPYIDGGRPSSDAAAWRRARRLVEEDRVGGFIVGVGPWRETASWLNELQRLSSVPLLMTADLEWGPGTRLRGATVLPINMAIAAAGAPDLAYEAGRITGLEGRAAGLHMAYAPVADVNVNPLNPVINTRAYGSDVSVVADRVAAFVAGVHSAGMLAVAKHFPGHGDTEVDSHLALPVLLMDRERLDAVELPPFRSAIDAGAAGVMMAHVAVPAIDPGMDLRPATLSPGITKGLLRGELGFRGLVVTDAMNMDGVTGQGTTSELAVAAVLAGADIVLQPANAGEAIDGVVSAVERGVVPLARVEQSVRMVLAAKAAAGLHAGAQVNLHALAGRLSQPEHTAWAGQVTEQSMTLVRADRRSLPLEVEGRTVLVLVYGDRAGHRWGADFEAVLSDRGARVQMVRLSRRSAARELAEARRRAAGADVTIVTSYSRALPWRGGLGLPENVAGLMRELAASGAPVVSFGDPYLLRQIPDARNYLLAWSEVEASQRAAARALLGEIRVAGRLPIDLPPYYTVGHGLMLSTGPLGAPAPVH